MGDPLRHDREGLGVSTITGQYYCEYKVHLEETHPEIEVESAAAQAGTERHRDVERAAVSVEKEEVRRRVAEGLPQTLVEVTLGGEIEGVPILGRADLLDLEGRELRLVLDLKFSRHARPFYDQVLQVGLYTLLAERGLADLVPGGENLAIGSACRGLVILDPRAYQAPKSALLNQIEQHGRLGRVLGAARRGREAILSGDADRWVEEGAGWNLFVYPFDRQDTLDDLRWALEYWRGEREPKPTSKENKCRRCPFNAAGVCGEALTDPADDITVERRDNSTLVRL